MTQPTGDSPTPGDHPDPMMTPAQHLSWHDRMSKNRPKRQVRTPGRRKRKP